MQDAMLAYFTGEKNGGRLLVGIAVIGPAAAAILFQERWGLRSFAITIAVVAFLELAIGVGLYARTGPPVGRLVAQLDSDARRFFADEGVRMRRVQRNFELIQYAELAVIFVAGVVAITQKGRPGITGVALGLLIQAAVLLAFDVGPNVEERFTSEASMSTHSVFEDAQDGRLPVSPLRRGGNSGRWLLNWLQTRQGHRRIAQLFTQFPDRSYNHITSRQSPPTTCSLHVRPTLILVAATGTGCGLLADEERRYDGIWAHDRSAKTSSSGKRPL